MLYSILKRLRMLTCRCPDLESPDLKKLLLILTLPVVAVLWTPCQASAQFPGCMEQLGRQWEAAFDVSADGSVVVGQYYYINDSFSASIGAFRWTATGGTQYFGSDYQDAWATSVSADGNVWVGAAQLDDGGELRAVRWTAAGIQDLGTLGRRVGPGGEDALTYSFATAVSADGSVVVGYSDTALSGRAFRWNGGMQDLGTLGSTSHATAVSADGSVVVGYSYNAAGIRRAFRWTTTEGMQDLGTPAGDSYASAVSADGSVVVGTSELSGGFRWSTTGGMENYGTFVNPSDVSADGTVIVGWEGDAYAVRWTATGEHQELGRLQGDNRFYATAISADGRVVVGVTDQAGWGRSFRWRDCSPSAFINPAGGAWGVASNWSTNTVPGPNDPVQFNLTDTYLVTDVPESVGAITVTQGEVTFNGAASSIATAAGAGIRITGGLAIFNTPLNLAGDLGVAGGAGVAFTGRVSGNLISNGEVTILVGSAATEVNTFEPGPDSRLRMKLQTVGSGAFGLTLSAPSRLDGTLEIVCDPGLRPIAGDRYGLIGVRTSRPPPFTPVCSGRFSSITGLVVPAANQTTDNEVYFGVDQRDRASQMPAIDNFTDVEVFTLAVPRRTDGTPISNPRPGHDSLVIMFHGWNADFLFGGSPDLRLAATGMNTFATTKLNGNRWDVALADWSGSSNNYNAMTLAPFLGAEAAAYRSAAVGASLAAWMREKGLNYQRVHTVAHSAGTWASYHLLENYAPATGLVTLLDGFIPPRLVTSFGVPCVTAVAAETYFDSRDLGALYTSVPLDCAVNYEVTTFNDAYLNGACSLFQYDNSVSVTACTVAHHGWPKEWYANTVLTALAAGSTCENRLRQPGFEMSLMYDDYAAGLGANAGCETPLRLLGPVYDLTGQQGIYGTNPLSTSGLNASTITPGPTGTVIIPMDGTVSMRTGSPVEFATIQSFEGTASGFSFNLRPITSGDGRLFVFVNDQLVAVYDEQQLRDAVGTDGTFVTGQIAIRPTATALVTLRFLVLPGASGPTELEISNLEIVGSLTTGPSACSPADITDGGGAATPDGTVDGSDFIAFINSFAIGDAAIDSLADIAGGGDIGLEPDGTIDGTDFIFFINAFAIGC